MSATVRYWAFVGAVMAGLAVAVSTPGAQDAPPRPHDSAPGARVFDTGASRIGVMVRDLEPAERGAAAPDGVWIDAVDEGGPGATAGLRAGDVVVEYDGERVRSARQFTRLVQETPAGRPVSVAVLRDGARQSLTATPEAGTFSWHVDIDGDQIRRDVERGLEGLRDLQMEHPALRFRMDGDGPRSARGRLGVTLNPLSDQLAEYFGAKEGGALIASVRKDSPAERAGLKAGDVITDINGQPVRDPGDVTASIARADNAAVTIGYLRDRKADTVRATVEPPPDRSPRRRVRPATFMRPA